MDPISQGALGAALSQSFASPERMRIAAVAGTLGGLAPDLDVLIRSSEDPLVALEFHRQFTHSFAFVPVGGALVAVALWLMTKRKWPFAHVFAFATLGWATHGLLDACTSYGTQLFWPFSDVRIAWNNIGIIDLVPTLAWLLGALVAYRSRRALWARLGFALALAYLTFGFVQRDRASEVQAKLIESRGHLATRAEVKPTILNLFVFRSIYESGDRFFVDAIYVGPTGPRTYQGDSIARFVPEANGILPGSRLARDVQRFSWFSGGWIGLHPRLANVVGDVRYALLPNDIDPLWGIGIDPSRPDAPVTWVTARERRDGMFEKFGKMIRGQPLE